MQTAERTGRLQRQAGGAAASCGRARRVRLDVEHPVFGNTSVRIDRVIQVRIGPDAVRDGTAQDVSQCMLVLLHLCRRSLVGHASEHHGISHTYRKLAGLEHGQSVHPATLAKPVGVVRRSGVRDGSQCCCEGPAEGKCDLLEAVCRHVHVVMDDEVVARASSAVESSVRLQVEVEGVWVADAVVVNDKAWLEVVVVVSPPVAVLAGLVGGWKEPDVVALATHDECHHRDIRAIPLLSSLLSRCLDLEELELSDLGELGVADTVAVEQDLAGKRPVVPRIRTPCVQALPDHWLEIIDHLLLARLQAKVTRERHGVPISTGDYRSDRGAARNSSHAG